VKSNLTQEDSHDDGDPSGRELDFPEEKVRKKVLKLVKKVLGRVWVEIYLTHPASNNP
jgi:hypothetical protein